MSSSLQPKAKCALQHIWMAETKNHALVPFEFYGTKYKTKDRDNLLAF